MAKIYRSLFETPLGVGAVAATGLGICQVWLPGDTDLVVDDGVVFDESSDSQAAAQQLQRYFQKQRQQFELAVDISCLSPFRQLVLRAAMQIPYGVVISYGELAARVGASKAARAIGGALAANPIPVIIPCHRIVSASGQLTGFSGPGGIRMKRFLLSMEAAEFRGKFF